MALRGRMPSPVWTRRALATLGCLVAAFVVLSILVAAGQLTWLDQFSVDHLMPWLVPGASGHGDSAGFYRPFTLHTATASKLLDLWTYPCSVLISGLVVAVGAVLLWPRLGPVGALAPAAAWVVGNAIEVAGKHTIIRPALYGHAGGVRVHIAPFDDSFPSGHMMRGMIVAGTIVLVWRRVAPWAIVWAILVGPALVLQSAHTISDVIGGALLGFGLLIPVYAVAAAPRPLEAASG